MTSRGRGGSTSDWDPMRDEFNDTFYKAQYPDDDASEGVLLDHTKLYITKLPTALSQEGFIDLFSKYGRVVGSFFNKDPAKKFAFVTFETAGEARIAMMKLNKTEPFNMNICFAHNKNQARTQQSQPNMDRGHFNTDRPMNRHSTTDRHSHNTSARDDVSVSSHGRNRRNIEEHANGNDDCEDTEDSDVGHDPKLGYDLEKLKLQRLQIMDQQLQVQQRMLIHQQRMKNNTLPVTKRRLLPDGRSIQVTQDNETSFTAGGGDSRNIPGLQREPSRQCVACGAPAELYCAACRVTPYCGERCQRRDWEARHRAVCHNLARSSAEVVDKVADVIPDVPIEVSLRRPHSPAKKSLHDSGSEKGNKKFSAPAEKKYQRNANQPIRNANQNQDDKQNRYQNEERQSQNRNAIGARTNNRNQRNPVPNNQMQQNHQGHQALRRPMQVDTKPTKSSVEMKQQPAKVDTNAPIVGLDVTPRKPLVPESFLIEKLNVGAAFLAEVIALAGDCGSQQAGYVCLTLHEDYSEQYDSLCDAFKRLCDKDGELYTPSIGETFAYFCEEDGFWYRARCLARSRAALLDAGRVVSLSPAKSRRLPTGFAAIPEFMAVFNVKDLKIGDNLTCKVLSSTRASLCDDSGRTVEGDVTRWLPDLECSTEPQTVPQKVQKKDPEVANTGAVKKCLVPDSFIVQKLEEGTSFLAEVIALAGDCGSQQAGYVCLTLHEDYSEQYDSLCDAFKRLCDKDGEHYTPSIGETFAYFCEEDGFWYRARCLARSRAALLDAGRVVSLSPAKSRRLPTGFAAIPEFMAVFNATNLTIGDHLSCKLLSTSNGIRVALDEASGNTVIADAARWLPDVEYTSEPIKAAKAATLPNVPEVPRPLLERNTVYILLDVTSLHRACVRPSDPRIAAMFDSVLQDTLLYALTAAPLKEPPQKGQVVVAKFLEDGNHYRALVKRVNVNMNKYLIEYIEYGNEEIVTLDRLYPCPAKLQLDARPTQASLLKLSAREPAALTPAARTYIDQLKENAVELILTIPGGAKSAPSGSMATLVIAKNCEPASKQIEDLCTPEWKKLAERGGDVMELESCFYHELQYVSLPTNRPFTLRVTHCDVDTLAAGVLSGHESGDKAASFIHSELAKQIEEYCASSLCREPYLPKIEEICAVKHGQKWVRSVVVEMAAGADTARVLLLDSGALVTASTSDLRRLPRDLAVPRAAAAHIDIRDFPSSVSRAQLDRGLRFMRVDARGAGELKVSACYVADENMYEIDAPELIAALTE